MEKIGDRIRRLRLERGWSVRQLAEKISVATTTLREWEYGRTIRGEPYAKLAHALGVSLAELLTGQALQEDRARHLLNEIRSKLDELSREMR